MKIYRSKIGLELVIPVGLLFLWISYNMYLNQIWIGLLILLLTSVFLGYLLRSIKYRIDPDNLHIYGGFGSHKNIPIQDITKVVETHNPLSSAAASLDRLEIFFNKYDSVLVSPKEKKEFIATLCLQKPTIEVLLKKK
ncbi:PH domain-containing protein [uncultured Cyclobacterium sp.]|uniref:PH domain-containing protein n=1 Tax=uncultured Cyclobacterium sp. TaxID=453820 RepID=UPI0030ED443A